MTNLVTRLEHRGVYRDFFLEDPKYYFCEFVMNDDDKVARLHECKLIIDDASIEIIPASKGGGLIDYPCGAVARHRFALLAKYEKFVPGLEMSDHFEHRMIYKVNYGLDYDYVMAELMGDHHWILYGWDCDAQEIFHGQYDSFTVLPFDKKLGDQFEGVQLFSRV
jgi:hypothetical protein